MKKQKRINKNNPKKQLKIKTTNQKNTEKTKLKKTTEKQKRQDFLSQIISLFAYLVYIRFSLICSRLDS
jgi:hypothetical protein